MFPTNFDRFHAVINFFQNWVFQIGSSVDYIGITHIETDDPRQKYLEIAYTAPEEILFPLDVGIGILGYPREKLDTLLKPKERTKTADMLGSEFIVPTYNLPPKQEHQYTEFTQSLPKKLQIYIETKTTKKLRRNCINLWVKHVENEGNILQILSEGTPSMMGSMQLTHE